MKRKYLLSVAILGALISLGYCGDCDYKDVAYKSNTGTTWAVNVYVKQSTNQACIEDPHVGHSCGIYHGGCSYPFHGISVCFDDQNRRPCVGENFEKYDIVTVYNCLSLISCTTEAEEQVMVEFPKLEYVDWPPRRG